MHLPSPQTNGKMRENGLEAQQWQGPPPTRQAEAQPSMRGRQWQAVAGPTTHHTPHVRRRQAIKRPTTSPAIWPPLQHELPLLLPPGDGVGACPPVCRGEDGDGGGGEGGGGGGGVLPAASLLRWRQSCARLGTMISCKVHMGEW